MRRDVRILLVGDGWSLHVCARVAWLNMTSEGVGKSTIITSLIKESYVPHVRQATSATSWNPSDTVLQVQHIVPEVTIPPETTPENVTTYIVDSGGAPARLAFAMKTHAVFYSCAT